nr:MAG TPA: YopX protein [Caudoviricetes sp.]
MREILFRGKRVDNNEWVYGFLSKSRGNNHFLSLCIDHEENGVMLSSIVEPETIGQYTGLSDKSGVKIFEGDIVRYSGEKHIVVFETRGETGYFGIKIDHIETWGFCLSVPAKLMEVIGNIHDNPELAEGLL